MVRSTAAKSVIPKTNRIFSSFGIPHVVKSDNGSHFMDTDTLKMIVALAITKLRLIGLVQMVKSRDLFHFLLFILIDNRYALLSTLGHENASFSCSSST